MWREELAEAVLTLGTSCKHVSGSERKGSVCVCHAAETQTVGRVSGRAGWKA